MNEDDFVRAPLNLDMEISQDATETHQLELSKGHLQGKASSSMAPSKHGQSKSRAKNSSDLVAASASKAWLTRDGMRQPASLPNEPASAGERSPDSQDQIQLIDRRAVQASADSATWQQFAGTPGHRVVAHDYDTRVRSPGSGGQDMPAALKTPPTVDAVFGAAEPPSGTVNRRTLHASNQQAFANRNAGEQPWPQPGPGDEGERLPLTAEWSPMRAGAETGCGLRAVGASLTGHGAGTSAGSGSFAKQTEQQTVLGGTLLRDGGRSPAGPTGMRAAGL